MAGSKRQYVPKVRGCYECSQRRINCDRSQPSCAKCISKGLRCSGLGVRYRFNRDTSSTSSTTTEHKARAHHVKPIVDNINRPTTPHGVLSQWHNSVNGSCYINQDHANGSEKRSSSSQGCLSYPLSSLQALPDNMAIFHAPDDALESWKSYLVLHFARNIATELVVLDDQRNGWRHLVLPLAHLDNLVMDAVLSAAAFHFSSQFKHHFIEPNVIYARTIRRLQDRQNLVSQDTFGKQNVLLTLLVLLAAVMVNGFSDFPSIFNLLESALAAAGGEETLMQGELGIFVVRQIRKYRGYASPHLSQAQGVSRMRLTTRMPTLLDQHTCDGWECFMSYYHIYPQYARSFSSVYKLNQQACDIYVARVLAGPNGPPLTDMVNEFKLTLEAFPPATPGEHTLVWATFIAGAESTLPEHREYFSNALMQHYRRNSFANILVGLDYLKMIWAGGHAQDWTRLLPGLQVFIV